MIFDYVLCWLITFGISWSAANADGPFACFSKFRTIIRKKYGEDHWMDAGFNCPICLSLYVAIPVTFFLGGGVSMWMSSFGLVTLAMSLSPE